HYARRRQASPSRHHVRRNTGRPLSRLRRNRRRLHPPRFNQHRSPHLLLAPRRNRTSRRGLLPHPPHWKACILGPHQRCNAHPVHLRRRRRGRTHVARDHSC